MMRVYINIDTNVDTSALFVPCCLLVRSFDSFQGQVSPER